MDLTQVSMVSMGYGVTAYRWVALETCANRQPSKDDCYYSCHRSDSPEGTADFTRVTLNQKSLGLNEVGTTCQTTNGKERYEQESSSISPAESKLSEHDR